MNNLSKVFFAAAIVVSVVACGNRSASKKTDESNAEVSLLDKEFELLKHPTKEMLYGRWVTEDEEGNKEEIIFSPTGLRTSESKEETFCYVICSFDDVDYSQEVKENPDKYRGAEFIGLYEKESEMDCGDFVMDVSGQILEDWYPDPKYYALQGIEVKRYIKVED